MNRRRPSTTLAILASLLLAAAVPAATPVPAAAAPLDDPKPGEGGGEGGEKPKAPGEEEVKDFLKEYEKTVSKMKPEDAIAGVEQLRAWYVNPGLEDDLRRDILKAFKKVVTLRGTEHEATQEAAAKALGDCGEDATGLLQYMVDFSLKQKTVPTGVVRAGLKSLGRIASVKGSDVKFLTDLLKKDDEFIGDVARALAGYAGSPGVVRREIFEELLKMSEGVYSKSEANDPTGKRRWNIWGTEVVDAMQKITRQNFTKPPEFRKWLNDKDEGGGKNPRTWADPEPDK